MIATYNVHWQEKMDRLKSDIRFSRLPGTSSLIGGWLLGINAHSKHVEESVEFIKWELSNKISVHSSLLGQVSPFTNVFSDNELLTVYPWMNIINKQQITSRGKELVFDDESGIFSKAEFENIVADNIIMAMKGIVSPDQALLSIKSLLEQPSDI